MLPRSDLASTSIGSFSNSNMIVFSAKEVPIVLMFILLSCIWTHSEAGVYDRWSLSRIKRQQSCQDGTYDHEGRKCCYCAAGQRLKQHCTAIADTVCEFCDDGTYNLHPNDKNTCEPCTSCSHPNAGLESVEACTIYKDAVCQCKAGHYCPMGGPCVVCHPCDDCGGAENIKVSCSSANNTVCFDENKPEGGSNAVIVIVPIVIILLLAGMAIGVLFYRRKKGGCATRLPDETEMIERRPEEMQLLKGVDLSCHLQNIAEEVGWKAMRKLALRSGTSPVAIESHVQNHPNDAVESTFQLLTQWVEKQGSKAPETLVQMLREDGHNGKAEKVMEIIKKKAQPGNNQGS